MTLLSRWRAGTLAAAGTIPLRSMGAEATPGKVWGTTGGRGQLSGVDRGRCSRVVGIDYAPLNVDVMRGAP